MITLPVRRAEGLATIQYYATMAAFVLGAVVSGTALGVLCGIGGHYLAHVSASTPHTGGAMLGAGIAAIYGYAEMAGARPWIPQRHWQVPSRWSWRGSVQYGAVFGVILGVGFFTFIPFIGYYVAITLCVVTAHPVGGGIVMGLYGAARTLPVVAIPMLARLRGKTYTPRDAFDANQWILRADRLGTMVRGSALCLAAGCLLAIVTRGRVA